MLTELQACGFGNDTASVIRQKLWIDQAYLWVWNAQDPSGANINWSFEKVDQATFAVTGGSATPSMPADFDHADWIEDDQGSQLQEMEAELFDRTFAPSSAFGQTSARAWAYKVVNSQVVLGPTPTVSASYKMSYTRRVSHYNNGGAVVKGLFTDDGDTPIWPDHHMVVVFAAALTGHAMNSNPFAQLYEQLRDGALQSMRADLEAEFAPSQVWGDGNWSAYGF